MKKKRWTALLFVVCFVGSLGQPVAADGWSNGAQLVTAKPIGTAGDLISACGGLTEMMSIVGESDPQAICLDQHTVFATTGTFGSGQRTAVRFGNDVAAYPLVNCVPSSCRYDPAQDSIVTKQRILPNVDSLVIYRHAMQRLQKGDKAYSFDLTNPDYVDWNSAGYPLPVQTFQLSANGRWLAIGLYGSGFAVMDMHDLTMTKVASWGSDVFPTWSLGISDDGKELAITGMHSGDFLILISDGCGYDPLAQLVTELTCEWVGLDSILTSVQNGFEYAANPVFSGSNQLSMNALYWPSTVFLLNIRNPEAASHTLGFLGLGDSYTSGEGESDDAHYLPGTNQAFEKCHTSDRSYPFLVAKMEGGNSVRNVACSGARIVDLVANDASYAGQSGRLGPGGLQLSSEEIVARQPTALVNFAPGEIPQGDFVEYYHPQTIFVGIGGNDAGLMDKMLACMMPDECEWVTDQGKAQTRDEIAHLKLRLGSLYKDLQRRSPESRIFAVGYPQIVKPDGPCDAITSVMLDHAERNFMEQGLHYIDQVISEAAAQAGIAYLDIENAYGEHRLCGSDQPAVNELQIGDDVAPVQAFAQVSLLGDESFHPTPLGHQLVADMIKPQLDHVLPCASNCTVATAPSDWSADSSVQAVATQLTNADPVAVSVPGGTLSVYAQGLQPGSITRVELHSSTTVLATPIVDTTGDVSIAIDIPTSLSVGYHTLHLFGTSFSGQQVDYYQVVLAKGDVTINVPLRGVITTEAPGKLPIVPMPTKRLSTTMTPAVLGASDHHIVVPSATVSMHHNWWKIGTALALVANIILIGVLTLRAKKIPIDDS